MNKPFRVLHIFCALDSGGVSNFVMNLYRELDTKNIQFDFAMTSGEAAIYDDEVLARGGRIFYFDTSKSIVKNLRNILQKKGPFRAVHSHVFFYSGLVMAEARRAKVPVRIAHAHNAHTGEPRSLPRRVYEFGMRMLIRTCATHLLGCSEKACRYVFGDRIMKDSRAVVIPDGIDCSRFDFDPEARDKVRKEYEVEGKFVVGHVGHFNPAKNHKKILSVFRAVLRKRQDAMLLLVGDGELEQDVRQYADELSLTNQVVFAGAHKDVERFYQAMDVFLFPSRYEGFGMAMIEAQASGLSCVASDIVPKETNIDGRTVFLPLKAGDDVWAEKILKAPARNTAAFEKICEKYSASKVVQEIMAIYL